MQLSKEEYARKRIHKTAIKNSYNKENVECLKICYTRIWDIFVHTYDI